MNLFKYCLYIFLMSVYENFAKARNAYENPHYSERDNFEQINSPYSKRKNFREEYDGLSNDVPDPVGNGAFDQVRSHQYEPSEMYYQQNRMSKLNSDMYDVKKRDYYSEMKNARDGQYQYVLDPKSRKPVAVLDNPDPQSYDAPGWRNQRDYELNQGNCDNELYSQGNQDQVVVYPVNKYDRMMGRMEYSDQQPNQNLRNSPEYNQYRNMPNKDNSMKIKRHVTTDQDNKHNVQKLDQVEKEKINTNVKRNIPKWSKDQIQSLKTSLSAFQENNAEYDNLKNILTNMGLYEKSDKRETKTNDEDENLNNNNIVMRQNVKRWEDKKRPDESLKRNSLKDSTELNTNQQTKRKTEQSNDNEELDRKRRDFNNDNTKSEKSEGQVKSPSLQDEKVLVQLAEKNLQKRHTEDDDYDQKIESEIQAKIDAIKEKVKREILMEQQKRQNARAKRSTTLLDSETKNINPEVVSYDSLKPHVRTRRHTNETIKQEQTSDENEYNTSKKNINERTNDREKIQFIKDLNSSNRIYESHKRTKRDINNKENPEEKTKIENKPSDNKLKKEVKNDEEIKKREINDPRDTSFILKDKNKLSRSKRANNYIPENKLIYRPYLAQDEGDENENGEFNNLYDQQYVEKRDIYEPDYQYFEKDDTSQEFQAQEKSPGYMETLHPVRRQNHFRSNYFEDAGYEQSPSFYSKNLQREYHLRMNRDKRENDKLQRNAGMRKFNKELNDKNKRGNNIEKEESSESENEFFGGLPQNYQEGELNRYKRIKRTIHDEKLPNQT